jgi:DNA-binding beta-propeller fold protein YncE
LCEQNAISQQPANALFACSAIYVLDGDSGIIKNIIHLGPGKQIKETTIDAEKRMLFASGEYNYLDVAPHSSEEIQFEDDVVYIIDSNNGGSTQAYNAISRITLYGEMEEGKEGDISDIAVDTTTDTIYAGIRYFQGGREGVFVIPEGSVIGKNISLGSDYTANDTKNGIRFIQIGNTGPDQVMINEAIDTIYASLKNDNFITIINGSSNTIKEEVILEKPRAMSLNLASGLYYVASGDSHWFNVIDAETNKVVTVNTQISYPQASIVDNTTGKVYVANCLRCDDFDFTNGTSMKILI